MKRDKMRLPVFLTTRLLLGLLLLSGALTLRSAPSNVQVCLDHDGKAAPQGSFEAYAVVAAHDAAYTPREGTLKAVWYGDAGCKEFSAEELPNHYMVRVDTVQPGAPQPELTLRISRAGQVMNLKSVLFERAMPGQEDQVEGLVASRDGILELQRYSGVFPNWSILALPTAP